MKWIDNGGANKIKASELAPGDWFVYEADSLESNFVKLMTEPGAIYAISGDKALLAEGDTLVRRVTFDCSNLRYSEAE